MSLRRGFVVVSPETCHDATENRNFQSRKQLLQGSKNLTIVWFKAFHIQMCVYVCMCVCVCVCVYVCVCVCTCECMYIVRVYVCMCVFLFENRSLVDFQIGNEREGCNIANISGDPILSTQRISRGRDRILSTTSTQRTSRGQDPIL